MVGSPSHIETRERLEELCQRLEGIAKALVAFDGDALLAMEPGLSHALEDLRGSLPERVPASLIPLAARARVALRRCEQLGISFGAAAGVPLHAADGYGRTGAYTRRAPAPALDVVT